MILPTVDACHWILHNLFGPRSLVILIIVPLIALLLSLAYTLPLGFVNLIIEMFILVGLLDRFLKRWGWCIARVILLNIGIESFKKFLHLLLHRVYQFGGIP